MFNKCKGNYSYRVKAILLPMSLQYYRLLRLESVHGIYTVNHKKVAVHLLS